MRGEMVAQQYVDGYGLTVLQICATCIASKTRFRTGDGQRLSQECIYISDRTLQVDAIRRVLYLQSIKTYFSNDDDFNWNYGIAKAVTGKFKEAEEVLSGIQAERHRCGRNEGMKE